MYPNLRRVLTELRPKAILERFNHLKSKIVDLRHEGSGPFLELCPGNDIDTAGGNHKIVDHEVVDRGGGYELSTPVPRTPQRS
jgi:hypothetical protein